MKTAVVMLFVFAISLLVWAQTTAPQVPVTGNIGPGGVFPLLNHGTIVMASDADYNMAYPDMSASVLRITSSVSLTATRNIINSSNTLGFQFTVENATTGGQSITVKGTSGTGVTIPNGQTMLVTSDGTNYVGISSSGGGIPYPTSAGIANYNGTAWATSYSATNQVPFNFLNNTVAAIGGCLSGQYETADANSGPSCAQVQYSQVGGTLTANTSGNAATATALSTSGTANQVWGMNSAGTAQGWETAASGGPTYSLVLPNVAMVSTAGPITLPSPCSGTTCTAVSPTADTSYRLTATFTQTQPGTSCTTNGSIQFWISYTDADGLPSGTTISNANLPTTNISATTLAPSMTMGNAVNSTSTIWNLYPLTVRVKGGTSLSFRVQQSVATAGCSPQPQFTVRLAFY